MEHDFFTNYTEIDLFRKEKTKQCTVFLLKTLPLERPVMVVDVGANPISPVPYSTLLRLHGCNVIGFEPQQAAFEKLLKIKSDRETYFPFAVGDGKPQNLKIYKASGMTSIFAPYEPAFKLICKPGLMKMLENFDMETVALDEVKDIPNIDLLKIDIQGGETIVFEGAKEKLSHAVAVIVETRYLQLYLDEPMMSGVDQALRNQGFILHKFLFNKSMAVANSQSKRLHPKMRSQLIDGDAVYLRDITHLENYSDRQLMQLAILASGVFNSFDLAILCLDHLVLRGVIDKKIPAAYVDTFPKAMLATVEEETATDA